MDIEAIVNALDAGFDVEKVSMLERLMSGLCDQGITDEQELLGAVRFALSINLQDYVARDE